MGVPQQIANQAAEVAAFEAQVAADREAAAKRQEAENPEPPEPPAPPTPAPAPPPASSDEAALWKQRFLSLQGMYNQQVPSLQRELKEMKEQMAELSKVKTATPPPESSKGKKLVTDQDVTAFGADLIDVIKRGAQEQVAAVSELYEGKIAALEQQLAQATQTVDTVTRVQTQSVQDSFFERLQSRLPAWQTIQDSAECQNWLSQRIPGSQNTWNDALVGAADRFDVNAVMEVFDEFFRAHPTQKPGQPPAPAPAPRNRSELERQVTPQKTSASNTSVPNGEKRTYTGKDYENISMQIVRLQQQGRNAEATALEAELNAALRENRVRP